MPRAGNDGAKPAPPPTSDSAAAPAAAPRKRRLLLNSIIASLPPVSKRRPLRHDRRKALSDQGPATSHRCSVSRLPAQGDARSLSKRGRRPDALMVLADSLPLAPKYHDLFRRAAGSWIRSQGAKPRELPIEAADQVRSGDQPERPP